MRLAVTGRRSELGCLLPATHPSQARVHVNVAGQQANTLLHDGHAWRDLAASLREGVRRMLRAEADMRVHASFAFVRVVPPRDPLRSLALSILEAEALALSGPGPACVVRLGYLYGPTSRDLLAYRTAFQLGRPYWCGPRDAGQHHLHHDDAVSALLAAASPRQAGRTLYAIGSAGVPFMQFMDHFARSCGHRRPRHAPRLAAPLFRAVVREEHMQQVALAMPEGMPGPRVPGWRPAWPDHAAALDHIVQGWRA